MLSLDAEACLPRTIALWQLLQIAFGLILFRPGALTGARAFEHGIAGKLARLYDLGVDISVPASSRPAGSVTTVLLSCRAVSVEHHSAPQGITVHRKASQRTARHHSVPQSIAAHRKASQRTAEHRSAPLTITAPRRASQRTADHHSALQSITAHLKASQRTETFPVDRS